MKTNTKEQVKLAESIARDAHEGQFRKFGEDKGKQLSNVLNAESKIGI